MRDGYFHADMHQGNLLVDNSGQLIFIDFGIMGKLIKLIEDLRRKYYMGLSKEIILRLQSTYSCWLSARYVNTEELAQALRSIGEPIFGQSVKDISGGKLWKQLSI